MCIPVIPALRSLRQEDGESSKTSLGFIVEKLRLEINKSINLIFTFTR
jgi:hypothetical protein